MVLGLPESASQPFKLQEEIIRLAGEFDKELKVVRELEGKLETLQNGVCAKSAVLVRLTTKAKEKQKEARQNFNLLSKQAKQALDKTNMREFKRIREALVDSWETCRQTRMELELLTELTPLTPMKSAAHTAMGRTP